MIVHFVLDCGLTEKFVNLLVSCPNKLQDTDKVQMKCGLCLVAMLQFDEIQERMVSMKGSFAALFALFRVKSDEMLRELLTALVGLLSVPRVADICVENGLLVSLPGLVVHENVFIQSLAQKVVVSLLKSLTNKPVLRNQTLLTSLHRISETSSNEAVRQTAFKLLNIINSL